MTGEMTVERAGSGSGFRDAPPRGNRIRGWALVAVIAVLGAGAAQEGPSAAELKRMYDDAIGQLKGAQVRKNELAAENEKLAAHVTELEKQIKDLQGKNRALESEATTWAEKTWQLRATRAALNAFLLRDPAVKAKWDRYLDSGSAEDAATPQVSLSTNWPFGN